MYSLIVSVIMNLLFSIFLLYDIMALYAAACWNASLFDVLSILTFGILLLSFYIWYNYNRYQNMIKEELLYGKKQYFLSIVIPAVASIVGLIMIIL